MKEYKQGLRGSEDPDKHVSIVVTIDDGYELPEKFEKHLRNEIYELTVWVFRNMKEKEPWP